AKPYSISHSVAKPVLPQETSTLVVPILETTTLDGGKQLVAGIPLIAIILNTAKLLAGLFLVKLMLEMALDSFAVEMSISKRKSLGLLAGDSTLLSFTLPLPKPCSSTGSPV